MRTLILIVTLLASQAALAGPKLYLFDCGNIYLEDVSGFGLTNEETAVRELFVPCYLIEQNGKRLLWDGGLPLNLANAGRQEMQPGMAVEYKTSLIDQLGELNLTPADIDYASFSHYHFDHVGAANAFGNSEILIHSAEHVAAFERAADYEVFVPELYSALHESSKKIFEGDLDVFGDGSVVIVSAPGHTPGHTVLLVNLEDHGPVVLSGDLYHFEFNRLHRRTPVFNTDAEETLRSMDKVDALLEETGATLWLEHNKALADTLKKAPAFYK